MRVEIPRAYLPETGQNQFDAILENGWNRFVGSAFPFSLPTKPVINSPQAGPSRPHISHKKIRAERVCMFVSVWML